MDKVEELYNSGKLLVRAMELPHLKIGTDGKELDCSTWANEFSMLMNGTLSSASSTLIVPDVGVSTYKNIGFLVNSDLANCFHISKSDSGSSGNIKDGDFFANKADFQTIAELASYIKANNATTMNEVNICASLDSVVGLFINKCEKEDYLLKMIYVVKTCLKQLTNVDYPIYSYDKNNGKLNYIELTNELEEQIIDSLETKNMFYWPDDFDEPVTSEIISPYTHTI